jgi:Holliday junction resolvase RusA-like endonuclease
MTPYFSFAHKIEPLPKERPRLNRRTGSIYTPTKTRDYEAELAAAMAIAMRGIQINETDDLFAYCRFSFTGKARKDIDNCLKSLFDAGNKVVFKDDKQITRVLAEAVYECDVAKVEMSVSVESR